MNDFETPAVDILKELNAFGGKGRRALPEPYLFDKYGDKPLQDVYEKELIVETTSGYRITGSGRRLLETLQI